MAKKSRTGGAAAFLHRLARTDQDRALVAAINERFDKAKPVEHGYCLEICSVSLG